MIENFNKRFKNLCYNLKIEDRRFVLGLSGGIDSMALLNLLKFFVERNNTLKVQVYPVIIDHGLRSNSAVEANAVLNLALNLGFETIIKKINTEKPSGNIQNWARKERRKILCDITFDLSAILLLGHHSDDQAETIFMRSIKGSGIDGLVGMQEKIAWNGISIIRPLIFFNKCQVKKYVEENNIIYFQDISNSMFKFERVQVRKTLRDISLTRWHSISEDLIKFSFLNKKLLKKINDVFSKWVQNNILIDNRGAIRVDFKKLQYIFKSSNQFTINILGKIIKTVGGKEFSPKKNKTLNCLNVIFSPSFSRTNLGNVNIYLKNKYLFFIRENRNISFKLEIINNKKYIFDGRFILISKHSGNLIKSDFKDIGCVNTDNAFTEYEDEIKNTIPFMLTLEGMTVRPYFNMVDMRSDEIVNRKYNSFDFCLINRLLI
ncbi:tRNA lysidine(34) synthetase TilS [Alphaproteobacteria bacterium]|nr:tRNA lysidine(34) synthetase TilS [Alphaproteobacteria bacterium]